MKVIEQLVTYFWSRGALSPSEANHLVRHGFVRADALSGFKPPDPASMKRTKPPPVPPPALDLEDALIQRRRRRKRR